MDNYITSPTIVPTAPVTVTTESVSNVENNPILNDGDTIYEAEEELNLDSFQVVRREFFAHIYEPSVTFNQCKFYVNAACISKFPNTTYVQVMIDRNARILALRPCSEFDRDSFQWCSTPNDKGKRKAKQITCRIFFAKIVSMMGWDPNYRYKMLGKIVHANGEYLLVFDLTSTEVYERTVKEGEKPKMSRTPVYPEAWKNQFGLPYNEHRQSLQISTFEGYAVYSLKDPSPRSTESDSSNGTNDSAPLMIDAPAAPVGDGGQTI
ncbi:MAG: hypothetical protein IJ766_00065 [Clostridia bacterium]|nr:hypothetical protein [Clostridia bacterium]